MKRIVFIILAAAILTSLYSETINFSLDDYTFSSDSMIIKYKEKVYRKNVFGGTEIDVLFKEQRFDGQFAENVIINSYDSILIKPDMGIAYFDNPNPVIGDKIPKKPISIGARGIKRHGGFSVLELNPFFIHNDSLFFINTVNFQYTDLKKNETSLSKAQIYEKVDLAIITSEQFSDNFESYKDFKTKQGLNTVIKTIEEIYAEYPGETNVMKIRNFIKDKYVQNDLEFVIIGGGYEIVPAGEATPYISIYTNMIHVDTFYSHLDKEPDGNKNGIYFELEDEPDYYADVYVGRFPGNNEAEIDAIIKKTVKYYSSDRNFRTGFNTSSLLLGFDVDSAGDGRRLCNNIKTEHPVTFMVDSMYEGVTPDFSYLNMMSKFNVGYNFVYSQSHGALHLIRQRYNQFKIWSDQIMDTDAVSGLYFIASCDPGEIGEDSFSRKALISPDGGCVNYIGMSGSEWPGTSNNMNAYFFNGLFDNKTYGQSFTDAAIMYGNITSNSTARYLNFGYAFQGDPSNRPFLREPVSINISSLTPIKRGAGTVSGSFSQTPNDTVFVTLTDGNRVISKTKTLTVNFTFNYDNLASDSAYISYHSQELYLKTYGYATTAADVIAFQLSGMSLSEANRSGVAEHGESFGLSFKFSVNSNPAAIDSLVAVITAVDNSNLSVINGTKRFKLPNAGSYFNISAFTMSYLAPDSVAADSVAVVIMEIRKKDGTKLSDEKIYIPVAVPYLKLQSVIRTVNAIQPVLINPSKGTIDHAKIELIEITKSLLPDERKVFSYKSIVELEDIYGYKLVTDSVNFSIDSTKAYRLKMTMNGAGIYYSEGFNFSNYAVQPITLYGDHSPGQINMEWTHSYSGDLSYNVYSSATENFSTKLQRNFEKIYADKFSFNYDSYDPVWVKVALVDSAGYEFTLSDPVRIEPIRLYKDTKFKLAPFQLYNPVFIDGKLISNSQNSSIAGIYQNGIPVNGTGLIHEADILGFSGTAQQGFAVGDVNADGSNDMVNYSFNNVGDSTLVKIVDLTTGTIVAQRKIYGKIMETSPVLVNSDADPQLEIMISVFNGDIGGTPKGSYVYMLDLSGNSLNIVSGFPLFSSYDAYNVHSPSLVDMDVNGTKEIVFDCSSRVVIYNAGNLTKIIDYALPKTIQSSISYCDINADNIPEVFVLTNSYGTYGKMFCYNFNGTTLVEKAGTTGGINVDMKPYSLYDLTPPVSFADIDDNGTIEIIVLTASKLYVFNNDFTAFSNFPVALDPRVTRNNMSAPSMADFDGDGDLDVLFMDANYRIWCYSGSTGTLLSGFPVLGEGVDRNEIPAMAVADLDTDGDLEFSFGANDGMMVVYDYAAQSSTRPVFDNYRGDTYNSGLFYPLVPSAPSNVSVNYSGTEVVLSWFPVAGALKYKVYSSSDPYGVFAYVGETSNASFTIYGVTEKRKFYYIVTVR